jgi:HrpA-like RNA helicase
VKTGFKLNLRRYSAEGAGDILVFLTGEEEIESAVSLLQVRLDTTFHSRYFVQQNTVQYTVQYTVQFDDSQYVPCNQSSDTRE